MKRLVPCVLIIALTIVFIAPVYGEDVYKTWRAPNAQPNGEKVLWDALVMRPAGLITCVLGIGGFIVSLPFALTSQTQSQAFDSLVVEPFTYTFSRPVGLLDPVNP